MLLEAFDKIQKDYLTEGYTAPAEFLNISDAEIAEAEKKFGETCKTEFNPQTKTFNTYNPKGDTIVIDWEAFHKAYDKAFTKFGILDLFSNTDPEEANMARNCWFRIKDLQGSNPYEKRAIKALKMVWGVINKNVYHSAVVQRKINDERARDTFIKSTIVRYKIDVEDEIKKKYCTEVRKYFETALDNINSGKFEVSPEFTEVIKEAKNITNDDSKLIIEDFFIPYQSSAEPVLFTINNDKGNNSGTSRSIYDKFGMNCTIDDVRSIASWNKNTELYIRVVWNSESTPDKYVFDAVNNDFCLDIWGRFKYTSILSVEQAEKWLAEKFNTAIKTGKTKRALDSLKKVTDNIAYHASIKDLQGYELISKYTEHSKRGAEESNTSRIVLLYVTPDFSDAFEVDNKEARSLITGKAPVEMPVTSILFAAKIYGWWSNNDHSVIHYRSESWTSYSWNSKITSIIGIGDPTGDGDPGYFLTDSHFEVLKSPSGSCIEGYGFDSWAKEESTTYAD